MAEPDAHTEAAAAAQTALELMGKHGVPPTSANYAVWLAYAGGEPQDLRTAIDARISSGEPFTFTFNADLHERFFTAAESSAQIMLAGERIARDLEQVVSFLQQSEQKSGDYGRTLESAATDLNRGMSDQQMRQLVSSLAAATLDMANHNQHLNTELKKSTKQVETLRTTLKSVRVESLTDALTGLANRRMFDETLRMRMEEARGDNTDLCLMLCDVDHFKRFNDTWGHHTGDQILRFLASAMQAHARKDFLVARYGGEEFAMVAPRLTLQQATQTANALRKAIETKRLRRRSTNEDLGQVTISIGVARMQRGDTMPALIERADGCLYSAKRNGRNQVITDAQPALYVA